MCGIFGLIAFENNNLTVKDSRDIIKNLFVYSESRGKESSGIALKKIDVSEIRVLKKNIPAKELINSEEYSFFWNEYIKSTTINNKFAPHAIVAHSRLVTNGSELNNDNNQPIQKEGYTIIHNGIITNVEDLWKEYSDYRKSSDVDTEIIGCILKKESLKGTNIVGSVNKVFQIIEGSASICVLNEKSNEIILATNTGSLYYAISPDNTLLVFASEKYILQKVIEKVGLDNTYDIKKALPLKAGICISFILEKKGITASEINHVPINENKSQTLGSFISKDKVLDRSFDRLAYRLNLIPNQILEYNIGAVSRIKRCNKCLLPATFPFVVFDKNGTCNICNNYSKRNYSGKVEELKKAIEPFRSKNGYPDVIFPFSGGRDSSFGLHYIVNELKLKPITYTYDWGMVTDLARRNISRMCGKLGVENILVSANIKQKRNNIKKNVEAWLLKPELGMIPLFMAGDKQFFYYVNKVKKETNIKLDIWSMNRLENTDFKVGFSGVRLGADKKRIDYLPILKLLQMMSYYGKNFLLNPAYLNSSILDTLGSFYSYYAEPRVNYYQLFDYIPWNEELIELTLFNEYNWEISPDTTTTWRIGDGTAAFYNYIYYTVAGFSEFDTFRSNQIREGLIDRAKALELINIENFPRYDSIKWYLETIGVEFSEAIRIINGLPKLYDI